MYASTDFCWRNKAEKAEEAKEALRFFLLPPAAVPLNQNSVRSKKER